MHSTASTVQCTVNMYIVQFYIYNVLVHTVIVASSADQFVKEAACCTGSCCFNNPVSAWVKGNVGLFMVIKRLFCLECLA